ncbi:MAG: tetratricopeptide repeat protein [Reyranella sp.]|nr:tetratricopeptide repeat protein [Reyranella sp.]
MDEAVSLLPTLAPEAASAAGAAIGWLDDAHRWGLCVTNSGMLLKLTGTLRDAWRQRQRDAHGSAGSPVGPEQLFLRAKAVARAGDIRMAASLLEEAAGLDPSFSDALEAQGELLDAMGDSTGAMARYEQARQIRAGHRPGAPDRHFVWRRRGAVIAETIAYSSVLKSMRKHALPYVARGNSFLSGGQPARAVADYERALKLNPKDPAIRIVMGECLIALGRHAEAVASMDAALAVRPRDAEALGGRAIARMALGQVAAANQDWELQLQLLRGRAPASAFVALRLAEYERALLFLEAAAGSFPQDSYWTLYQRVALLRLGRALPPLPGKTGSLWPGPLLAFQAGSITAEQLLRAATTPGRRAEAMFQVGAVEHARDPAAAKRAWLQVVESGPPELMEFACARNELARVSR